MYRVTLTIKRISHCWDDPVDQTTTEIWETDSEDVVDVASEVEAKLLITSWREMTLAVGNRGGRRKLVHRIENLDQSHVVSHDAPDGERGPHERE